MGEVTVRVNGRPYGVGCEDGQEQHVLELAAIFDEQVSQVAREVGQLGDSRLFLLGALLLADELAEARGRLAASGADQARSESERIRIESRAVAALENAAKKIEALATKAG